MTRIHRLRHDMSTPTSPTPETATSSFSERRSNASQAPFGMERRQFGNTYADLSPDARELAEALDGYKLRHRRRYVNYEEMLNVIQSLGYRRD
jgi:hypothetical protein